MFHRNAVVGAMFYSESVCESVFLFDVSMIVLENTAGRNKQTEDFTAKVAKLRREKHILEKTRISGVRTEWH